MSRRSEGPDLAVDRANLYKEEVFTDLKVATLRRLTPILEDGSVDVSRTTLYVGQTQVLTQGGPIPVDAPIQANSFKEALDRFPEAVKEAIDDMVSQFEELRRREASRIVVPSGAAGGKILMP